MKKEVLIFSEDFEGEEIDAKVWSHEVDMSGGGNRQFEVLVDKSENSFVKKGALHIKPSLVDNVLGLLDLGPECTASIDWMCKRRGDIENVLPPIQSARLNSKDKFAFKYGRIEFTARLPTSKWTWPALWLMPNDEVYGPWPRSGELDIMESRGNPPVYERKGEDMSNALASATFHFGPDWLRDGYPLASEGSIPLENNETLADKMHVFGLYWTDTELYAYIDDRNKPFLKMDHYGARRLPELGAEAGLWDTKDDWIPENAPLNAPFDQEFYIIMNLAIGGTSIGPKGTVHETGYFPDHTAGKPWETYERFPQTSFHRNRQEWLPSWTDDTASITDNAALRVDNIKVWGFPSLTTVSTWDNNHKRHTKTISNNHFLHTATIVFIAGASLLLTAAILTFRKVTQRNKTAGGGAVLGNNHNNKATGYQALNVVDDKQLIATNGSS